MRKRANNKYISVHAIAGTEVVLLGLNAEEEAIAGLLGFNIFKKKDGDKEYKQLSGGRGFEKSTSDNKHINIRRCSHSSIHVERLCSRSKYQLHI